MSKHCFFCQSNINVTRSYDLVYFRDALRSKCQSCNRLCATYFKDAVCTCFFCGNQCGRIDFTLFVTWSCHNNFFYTGDFCRHNVHQYGRRIYSFSTRNVHTCFCNRSYFLTKHGSRNGAVKPAVLFLFFMIHTNVFFCFADNL